jgi:predicted nucleic acid-binding protein
VNASRVYFDTSMLIKRYVNEEGSDKADNYFRLAHRGEAVICFSEINLGEAATVFDKYSRKTRIDAEAVLQTMLSELKVLERSSSLEIYPVTSELIKRSINTVLKHHIYIIDAIQIETSIEAQANLFLTADKELSSVVKKIGIKTA